jgi:hypothetical protein
MTIIGHDLSSLSEHDRAEVETFIKYLRLVGEANRAGLGHKEAQRAIYPDVYGTEQEET